MFDSNPASSERLVNRSSDNATANTTNITSPVNFADEKSFPEKTEIGFGTHSMKEPSKSTKELENQKCTLKDPGCDTNLSSSSAMVEVVERHVARSKNEKSAPAFLTHQTWHHSENGPEHVKIDVDDDGNVLKKIIKTEQAKHMVQTQSYQTYSIDNNGENKEGGGSPKDLKNIIGSITEIGKAVPADFSQAQTHVIVYGKDSDVQSFAEEPISDEDIVSSKVVTTGNRTIETITYKTAKNGVVHTNVEHRVSVQGTNVDHEAEIRRAIIEATGLNPKYEVQRVEVKQERLS